MSEPSEAEKDQKRLHFLITHPQCMRKVANCNLNKRLAFLDELMVNPLLRPPEPENAQ